MSNKAPIQPPTIERSFKNGTFPIKRRMKQIKNNKADVEKLSFNINKQITPIGTSNFKSPPFH